MQNAFYFENSHVRSVPLLIGVKKVFRLLSVAFASRKIPQVLNLRMGIKTEKFAGGLLSPVVWRLRL